MGKIAGRVIVIFSFLFISGHLSAQTFSSYSILGIGDIQETTLTPHEGMGGLGISNNNVFYGAIVNPALIADNSFYSFAAGFVGEDRRINQGDSQERATGARLSNLSAVYPLKPGVLTLGLGLLPFTRVKYDFGTNTDITNDAQTFLVSEGSGGFNQAAISLGYNPVENVYIGGRISYIFSSIVREASTLLLSPIGIYQPVSNYRVTANDFLYSLGAAYKIPIAPNYKLNIGATYQFASKLSVIENQTLENRSILDIPISIDTLVEDQKSYYYMPNFYGLGLSLKKLTNSTEWVIGTDFRLQQMSDFKDLDGTNNIYIDGFLFTLGGEITPDVTNVENYFARMTYRAGINYNMLPYEVEGTRITEYGINFGFSLPVTNFSTIDLSLKYGQRGTTDNNLIRDDFLRVHFGVTFNDGRWFQRPKFN